MKAKQRGLTLLGFLLVLALILFAAYLGMKIVPIYLNHYSVVTAMEDLAEEPGVSTMSEVRIRDRLSRKFSTSYVKHITARDIAVERGSGLRIVADYEVREDLIGNMDVVVTFRRVQQLN